MMKTLKKLLGVFAIPLGAFVAVSMVCRANDIALFATNGHVLTWIRSAVIIVFTAWALSFNLESGRFDFSLGAIASLASTIAAQITINLQLPAIMVIVLSLAAGALCGTVSGLLYVILRLPPIITSLGVTLLFEAIAYALTNGEGLLLTFHADLLALGNVRVLCVLMLGGFAVVWFLANMTTFGYHIRALQFGQKISVNTGLNEEKNAVACYTVAGMLMGVVGFVNMTARGSIGASLNFSTVSSIFTAFLPLYLGGFIGRFSEGKFGILLGSLTAALITLGFVRMNVSAQMQSLINAVILLVFLIYLNNEDMLKTALFGRKRLRSHN